LDIDFAGERSFSALESDTEFTAWIDGEVKGLVRGYDAGILEDTLRFRNAEHTELIVNAPLDSAGRFRFPSFDLLGGLDGTMKLRVFLHLRKAGNRLLPDTLNLYLNREQ
jgi:hypothetical protein